MTDPGAQSRDVHLSAATRLSGQAAPRWWRSRGWRDALYVGAPVIVVAIVAPAALSNHLLVFNFVMMLALAQGLNVIYGFTGYLPFGYVGFFGAGAYGFAIAVMDLHWGPGGAMVLAALTSVGIGLLLSPLLRLTGAYFAIATFSAAEGLYEIVANPTLTFVTRGPYGVSLSSVFDPAMSYAVAVAVLALSLGLVVWLGNSRFGLALRALRDDPIGAAMAGFPVVRARVIAWILSALVAGLAGGVYGWRMSVFYPDTTFNIGLSLFAIVFTLFGGAGTLIGPVFGVVVLYGLYNVIGIAVPQYFQLLYGLLIMGFVLFLPQGLTSLLSKRGFRVP